MVAHCRGRERPPDGKGQAVHQQAGVLEEDRETGDVLEVQVELCGLELDWSLEI